MQKEVMNIEEFMDIYGVTRSGFYLEKKKYPWLATKRGKRVFIRRIDADKWLDIIKQENC